MADKDAVPVIAAPGEGRALWFLGTLATIKVDGERSGGRLGVWEAVLPKDAAPPLHKHPQDETFYVLEGEMIGWVGDTERLLTAGSFMYAPGGTPHTFLVRSETARVLTLSTPAGIERFVQRLSIPAAQLCIPGDDTYPPDDEIDAGFAEFGVEIVGPRPAPR